MKLPSDFFNPGIARPKKLAKAMILYQSHHPVMDRSRTFYCKKIALQKNRHEGILNPVMSAFIRLQIQAT